MTDPGDDIEKDVAAKPARIELRVVLLGVLAVIVLGGFYVLIAGSPTKNRAITDSSNAPPAPMYTRPAAPASAPH